MFVFFFFKQKAAYEMRISDWSSDVCSSDLSRKGSGVRIGAAACARFQSQLASLKQTMPIRPNWAGYLRMPVGDWQSGQARSLSKLSRASRYRRSEERRVGKECVST